MVGMKKWNLQNKSFLGGSEFKIENLINILLKNRNIKTKKEKDEFLNPKLENVTIKNVGIDEKNLNKALKRIEKSVEDR